MNRDYLTEKSIVRKITYTCENDLHAAINSNLINHGLILKLASIVPVDESTAYIVLVPDTDKILVQFVDIAEDGERELFPDSPNAEYLLMSIAELNLLKENSVWIDDTNYEVADVVIEFNSDSTRLVTVQLEKIAE